MFSYIGSVMGGKYLQPFKGGAWHKPLDYVDTANNYTASWVAHSMPFGSRLRIMDYNKSIWQLLDGIKTDEAAIIVVSHGTHLLPYHYSIFKERLDIYKRAIAQFLGRNQRAVVFVKGMTAWKRDVASPALYPDCFSEFYDDIVRCALSGISERLIFLNHRDMTIMAEEVNLHPTTNTVREMVNNMLDFIC